MICVYEAVDIPASDFLLIDDHALVANGLKELLVRMLPDNCTVDISTSVEKAKANLQAHHYRFLITDLMIPGQNVWDFIAYSRKHYPELIILVVSSVIDTGNIKECLMLGVNGYISKAVSHREFKLALEYTFNGKKFVSSDVSSRIAGSILSVENTMLTKKELEVLRLIASGYKTKVIGDMLHISPITVMTHKRSLLRKLGLHSATELVKYAYDNHLT